MAQITNVIDTTSTPTPGRDYIHMLNETVDPATGSLSLRIDVPTPKGRKLSLPFAFAYDSNGAWYVIRNAIQTPTQIIASSNQGPFAAGGWSYTVPQLSSGSVEFVPQIKPTDGSTTCDASTGFVFTDPSGGRHALGISNIANLFTNGKETEACSDSNMYEKATGGDGAYQAALPGASTSYSTYSYPSNGTYPTVAYADGTPKIADADGMVYAFPDASDGLWSCYSFKDLNNQFHYFGIPSSIEDRNGNTVSLAITPAYATCGPGSTYSLTETDTLGRTLVSASNFGTTGSHVTVSGLSTPYTLTWVTSNSYPGISITHQVVRSTCGNFPTTASGDGGVTAVALPNGQQYVLSYDSTSGFLSKITYPSGGYVSYTWGVNPQSSIISYVYVDQYSNHYSCFETYDSPAVTHRYVSFDGTNVALQQDFSYSTTWNTSNFSWTSKTTTVTTHDLVRGTSFQTTYTYSGVSVADPPNLPQTGLTHLVPTEATVAYYGTNGALLKTVTKAMSGQWGMPPLLGCEIDVLDNNQISGAYFSYATGQQLADKKEYDYGVLPSGSTCQNTPTAPSGITPTRETTIAHQSFAATPIYTSGPSIFDQQSSVITYGTGTRVAETDYSYDQASVASVSPTPTGHDETNYAYTKSPPRGNVTTAVKQCIQSAPACATGSPKTTYTHDETGQVLSMIDPNGNATGGIPSQHTTNYSYTDSYTSGTPPGNTNAYLTQVTYPPTNSVSHVDNLSYGYADGQLTKSKDQNGQTTTYVYNDSLDRLTETDFPDGGKTTVAYNDAPPTPSVTTTKVMNSSQSIVSVATTDGVGHVTQTQLTSDPQGTDTTLTNYDGLGRTYKSYNPYRSTSDPTYGSTIYVYDSLGRTTSVTKPDNSVVTTQYCGPETLVTDEAAHWRRSKSDAFGRLIEVDEPNSTTATVNVCPGTGEPIWITTYTYDTLNDLLGVVQGGTHGRTFAYNSLKQLLQSTNPESGTICYGTVSGSTCQQNGYDANGNVIYKTDARSITTTATYDALNRITGLTYSNSDPSVSYTYDQDQSTCLGLGQNNCYNIGHRTTMTDAGGTENLAYDKMGRELVEQRITNSVTKSTTYTYDLAGDLATLTYPSTRMITYTYDSAGRPSEAQDVANSINYALGTCANGLSSNGVCYGAFGSVEQIKNGTNLVSTYLFNTRLQPCWMYATTGTALPTNTACTGSATAGNILDLKYNFNLGSGDNGNVIGITNNRTTARTQTFVYDQVNRIATGETTSTTGTYCWGETYTLDQWANLTAIGAVSGYTGCTQENLSVSVNANNQLSSSGFGYDAAGNLQFTPAPGSAGYTYNAESEITQADTNSITNYVYDGDGNRLEKSAAPNGIYKIYWYGAGTEILDESDQNGNFTNEYVFFGGKRIAMRTVSTGTIYYYEEDMLATSRTIVQAGQTSVCYDADFYPFGGERVVTNTCSQNYKFEGKERDTETNNDDFGARYYSSQYGRWLSADWSSVPAPVPYANLTNPQTLNLYAMVSDNPESFADLDGHSGYNPSTNAFQTITGCGVELKECPDQQPTSQNTGAAGAITVSTQQNANTVSVSGPKKNHHIAHRGKPIYASAHGRKVYIIYSDGTLEIRTGHHAWRDANPGDIEYHSNIRRPGQIGHDGRFIIFGDAEEGFSALTGLLSSDSYSSLTVDQTISRFAPPTENDTAHYQEMIHGMGLPGGAKVGALNQNQMKAFTAGIAQIEGFNNVGTQIFPEFP